MEPDDAHAGLPAPVLEAPSDFERSSGLPVLVHQPDPPPRLHERPVDVNRPANERLWEEHIGANVLARGTLAGR